MQTFPSAIIVGGNVAENDKMDKQDFSARKIVLEFCITNKTNNFVIPANTLIT